MLRRIRNCYNWPPTGNYISRVQWSRNPWRHVTPKGQGHDPKIFEAPYLHNCARYTHGYNWPPIGSRILRVKWSRDWWRHVTPKGQSCSRLVQQWDRYLVPQNVYLVIINRQQKHCVLTSLNGGLVGSHPVWHRETSEQRETEDEEITAGAHVTVLQAWQTNRWYQTS